MKFQNKKNYINKMSMSLNRGKNSQEPENNDVKSGLAVISGVVKSGKISITKACKNLGPKKLGC